MSDNILELTGVEKSFGNVSVIRGVNLAVRRGERHAVIGPNGAGKSSLFNLISGQFSPTAGDIRLRGEAISGMSPFAISHRGLARSFQGSNLFGNMTVHENVRCGVLHSKGIRYSFWQRTSGLREVEHRTRAILQEVGLTEKADSVASVLPYADQRALEIAITIAGGAEVILLDEPTAGMSRSETAQAVALIERSTRGKTLVIVEHDMSVVFNLADRISVLVYGEMIATGTPEEIRRNQKVREAYLGEEADHLADGAQA